MQHIHWRGCKEWKNEGLALSTTSNEAAKLFDAALTQYVSWKELDCLGGLTKTLNDLKEADPSFILGHVLTNALKFMSTGTSPIKDKQFRNDLDLIVDLSSKSRDLTSREKLHVKALKSLIDGSMSQACNAWEEILSEHPTDMLALKLAHDAYFFLGDQGQMKASVERVIPQWNNSVPLYNYLYGMKAFALCENKEYLESEAAAKKGLELDATDAWSTHALAHDFEMTGRFVEGEKFLETTVRDWETCNLLSCHIHWHSALYSIEKGEYEKAVNIFDEKIGSSAIKSGAMLDLVDACSLLYRLQLEDMQVSDRYKLIYDTCLQHDDDHLLTFNDLHFLMTFLGSGHQSKSEEFVLSMKTSLRNRQSTEDDYSSVTSSVGISVADAMIAFDRKDFAKATHFLRPVELEFIQMGGSDAQRDLFAQLLINSAINSKDPYDNQLAEELLFRRKQTKIISPLTDRLMKKFLTTRKH